MGRHTVEITQKDLHLYSTCKICNVNIYKDGICRARLIQDYNKHINSKRHIDNSTSKELDTSNNDLKIMIGDLQKQLDNVFKILETYDKKIIKLNNNMVEIQSLLNRRTIVINNPVIEAPTTSPSTSPVNTVTTVTTASTNSYINSDDHVDSDDDRCDVNCYNDDDLREKIQTKDSYQLIQTDMENFENFKEYMLNKNEDNNICVSSIVSEIESIISWFDDLNMEGVDKVEVKRIKKGLKDIHKIVEEIDNNYFDVVIDDNELNKLFQSIVRISKNTYNKININNNWIKI